MKNIVAIRFSAIGDAALCLPVIKNVLEANPDVQIYVVTKPVTAFIFQNIARLHVIVADVNNNYKGFFGILKLAIHIKKVVGSIYAVVDLHNVLRSKILAHTLRFSSKKASCISKQRQIKKSILSTNKKPIAGAKNANHITQIYAQAFQKVGFASRPKFSFPNIITSHVDTEMAAKFFLQHGNSYNIALAPFAMHAGKILPWQTILQVIQDLENLNINVFMYGNSTTDLGQIQEAEKLFTNVHNLHSLSFAQQVAFLQFMQCAITMDSANMHLAALQGVPLISIWGSTNMQTGFAPIGNFNTSIEIAKSNLPCRPCSVFGNKPCHLKTNSYACLNSIQSAEIVSTVKQVIGI